MSVRWDYYNTPEFNKLDDMYMPAWGEGETKATQITTAVNKLIYKWYNDGDVFDNTYCLSGWANDLSSYANWLYENTDASGILLRIKHCVVGGHYEDLLKDLANHLLTAEYLAEQDKLPKVGTVYKCKGVFKYRG